jgi:hypothetical protein
MESRTRALYLPETLVEQGVGQTIDDDRDRQGDESVPNTDQTVLGQVLAALCIPVGEPIETVPPVTRASETAHHAAGEVLVARTPTTTASGELKLRLPHSPRDPDSFVGWSPRSSTARWRRPTAACTSRGGRPSRSSRNDGCPESGIFTE